VNEVLGSHVTSLGLRKQVENTLLVNDIHIVGVLLVQTDDDLMGMRSFGRKSLREVDEALERRGLKRGEGLLARPSDPVRSVVEAAIRAGAESLRGEAQTLRVHAITRGTPGLGTRAEELERHAHVLEAMLPPGQPELPTKECT